MKAKYVIKRGMKYRKQTNFPRIFSTTVDINKAIVFYSMGEARWSREYITDKIISVDITVKERK